MPEPIATYNCSLPGVKCKLELFADRISLSGTKHYWSEFTGTVPFEGVSPNYQTLRAPSKIFLYVSFLFMLSTLATIVVMLLANHSGALGGLLLGTAAAAITFFVWALVLSRKISIYIFIHELSGTPAFDLAYVRKIDKIRCEEFVARVVETIMDFRNAKSRNSMDTT